MVCRWCNGAAKSGRESRIQAESNGQPAGGPVSCVFCFPCGELSDIGCLSEELHPAWQAIRDTVSVEIDIILEGRTIIMW